MSNTKTETTATLTTTIIQAEIPRVKRELQRLFRDRLMEGGVLENAAAIEAESDADRLMLELIHYRPVVNHRRLVGILGDSEQSEVADIIGELFQPV